LFLLHNAQAELASTKSVVAAIAINILNMDNTPFRAAASVLRLSQRSYVILPVN
jgi:hypothetical protein